MKKGEQLVLSLVAVLILVFMALTMAGCSNLRLVATPRGDAAMCYVANPAAVDGVIDPSSGQSSWIGQHWGKVASGLIAGGGAAAIARNNHWFGWGKSSNDDTPAGNTSTIVAPDNGSHSQVTITGNGNTVIIEQQNDNSGGK